MMEESKRLCKLRAAAYREQAQKLVIASGNAWEAGEREAARWLAGQAAMCHERAVRGWIGVRE